MSGRLVAVSGTGTGIGKTHFSEALLRALQSTFARVAGLKPVETGLTEGHVPDAERLKRASSFHVQHFGYRFGPPISPHLAARESGQSIDLAVIQSIVERARSEADVVVLELAGGLFTPLSDSLLNVDVVRDLDPDITFLVAPDRLGVLHEVLAASRAAESLGVAFDGVVLVTPEIPDPSTGRNAMELLRFLGHITVTVLPRGEVTDLARGAALSALARDIANTRL
jgi:dethiobiotin synthetase